LDVSHAQPDSFPIPMGPGVWPEGSHTPTGKINCRLPSHDELDNSTRNEDIVVRTG